MKQSIRNLSQFRILFLVVVWIGFFLLLVSCFGICRALVGDILFLPLYPITAVAGLCMMGSGFSFSSMISRQIKDARTGPETGAPRG